MSVDLISTADRTGTVVAGAELLAAKASKTPPQPPRRFGRMIGWLVTGCFAVSLLPFAWMLWDKIRPLSAHEQLLVGTWAVGSVDEIDRWDEELPGIPCGVPRLEYHFHSDRTFHARKIEYFQGCGLFGGGTSGPMCFDVIGKWEVRGNDIILHPMQPLPSYSSRLKSAVQELSRGQNPLTCFNDGWGHDIHVTEWRSDGPLFKITSYAISIVKMHPSNGLLIELDPSLFKETFPLMLGDY